MKLTKKTNYDIANFNQTKHVTDCLAYTAMTRLDFLSENEILYSILEMCNIINAYIY